LRSAAHADAFDFLTRVVNQREEAGITREEVFTCLSGISDCAFKFQELRRYEHYLVLYEQLAQEAGDIQQIMRASLRMAECIAEAGRISEAAAKYQSLIRTYETGVAAHEIRLRYAYHLLQRMGKPVEALKILLLLKDSTEGSLHIDCLLALGRVYWKLG